MTKALNSPACADVAGKAPKPPAMALEWGDDNVLKIEAHGDFGRILTAAANAPMHSEWLGQIAKLGSQGRRTDEGASNFALGFVDCMKPRDAAELLLATQMAAIHQATMMMARRLNHVDNIPQQESAEKALNKLARTYSGQMDTLKRYRSKGQQTVRVERVTVEPGAQAVVGNVNHGGESHDKR